MTLKKGDTITYERNVMFKGTEKVQTKVVGIFGDTILLDNGDELSQLGLNFRQ